MKMSPLQHLSAPLPCRIIQGEDPGTFFNVATVGFDPENSEEQAQDASSCVVFLHGAGHCAQSWGALVSRLNGAVKVIAPDQRGHGASRASDEADLRQGTLLRVLCADFCCPVRGWTVARLNEATCVCRSLERLVADLLLVLRAVLGDSRPPLVPSPPCPPPDRVASNPLTEALQPTSSFPQRDG